MAKEFILYNTMTKGKEVFKPIVEGKVGLYVCGITSYDLSHIGHARAYVAFDVLYRYLRFLGYEVVYVRNFTDVDDKSLQDWEEAVSALNEGSDASKNNRIILIAKDSKSNEKPDVRINKLLGTFEKELANDLHAASILNPTLLEALKIMNSSINTPKKKQQKLEKVSASVLENLYKGVRRVLEILGFLSTSTYSEVLQQLKDKALKRAALTEEDVLRAIEERTSARENRDFARSDQIRNELAVKGIALMDVGKKTVCGRATTG